MKWLYTLGISLYTLLLHLVSIGHSKARSMVQGRSSTYRTLRTWRQAHPQATVIWVHCASLGEYEQAKPVLDGIRVKGDKVALSFYSPSGYRAVSSAAADIVFYLPADLPATMRALVEALRPAVYVMVKYDFWFNLLHLLDQQQIPTVVIAASIKKDSYLLKPYGWWFRSILHDIDHIYTQTQEDLRLLKNAGFENASVGGDTRVNRSASLPQESYTADRLDTLQSKGQRIILYGSVWPDDYEVIEPLIRHYTSATHLLAPHDLDTVRHWQQHYPDAGKWSDDDLKPITIINTIGELKYLYRYADLVYIGGGMHGALHNTLEPAAYRLPILVSGDTKPFHEVDTFVAAGVCKIVQSGSESVKAVQELMALPASKVQAAYDQFFKDYRADVSGIIQYIRHHANIEGQSRTAPHRRHR